MKILLIFFIFLGSSFLYADETTLNKCHKFKGLIEKIEFFKKSIDLTSIKSHIKNYKSDKNQDDQLKISFESLKSAEYKTLGEAHRELVSMSLNSSEEKACWFSLFVSLVGTQVPFNIYERDFFQHFIEELDKEKTQSNKKVSINISEVYSILESRLLAFKDSFSISIYLSILEKLEKKKPIKNLNISLLKEHKKQLRFLSKNRNQKGKEVLNKEIESFISDNTETNFLVLSSKLSKDPSIEKKIDEFHKIIQGDLEEVRKLDFKKLYLNNGKS